MIEKSTKIGLYKKTLFTTPLGNILFPTDIVLLDWQAGLPGVIQCTAKLWKIETWQAERVPFLSYNKVTLVSVSSTINLFSWWELLSSLRFEAQCSSEVDSTRLCGFFYQYLLHDTSELGNSIMYKILSVLDMNKLKFVREALLNYSNNLCLIYLTNDSNYEYNIAAGDLVQSVGKETYCFSWVALDKTDSIKWGMLCHEYKHLWSADMNTEPV